MSTELLVLGDLSFIPAGGMPVSQPVRGVSSQQPAEPKNGQYPVGGMPTTTHAPKALDPRLLDLRVRHVLRGLDAFTVFIPCLLGTVFIPCLPGGTPAGVRLRSNRDGAYTVGRTNMSTPAVPQVAIGERNAPSVVPS